MKSLLEGKRHIHMIGIGGSGMYPLAQVLHAKGYYLTGSDNNETDTLAAVRAMGIPVQLGQRAENLGDADLVVYSAAIAKTNPERAAAEASGVAMMERSELLGLVSEWYSDAVCIAGTHGKTTTSSMIAQILFTAGIDLSAVIGGKLPAIGGSGRAGSSDVFVCEACEYVDTFLRLSPDIAVILNIDEDHMEYFKTLENLKASFTKFAEKASRTVIYNGDDANTCDALKGVTGKEMISFGIQNADCMWRAEQITHTAEQTTTFTVLRNGEALGTATLLVPGEHNVLNALAAIAASHCVGLNFAQCQEGLLAFRGAKRRFDIHAGVNGITVADDYAHHPAEIAATLRAAKAMPYRRVIAVHQPFTYSRTKRLMDDFADALSIADIVALTDIMGGREENTEGVFTSQLAAKLPACIWFPQDETVPQTDERKYKNFDDVCNAVCRVAQPGDLIITLGCGDVNKLSKQIADSLRVRAQQ